MPEANNEAQRFRENLIDIGFGEEMIAHCSLLQKEGRNEDLLRILRLRRRDLLNSIHAEQKKLDCLDYLAYQLRRKGGTA